MRAVRQAVKLAGVALALVSLTVSFAQTTFDYNTQPRTFRVCRLLLPQDVGGNWVLQSSDNFSLVFEGMRRLPHKPAGWELINPLVQDPNALKGSPAYWNAPHAVVDPTQGLPAPVLRDMDLIYVRAPQLNLALDRFPLWRDALLRAVQDGAVLWVDMPRNGTLVTNWVPPGSMVTTGSPFTLALQGQALGSHRRTYAGIWDAASHGNITSSVADRLLDSPFPLQEWRDVQYLGFYPREVNALGAPSNTVQPDRIEESASPDVVNLLEPSLRPVVVVNDGGTWRPNIAAARMGAGAVVVTAGDVGYDVVNWWLGAHRNRPLQQEEADCKLAWNILAGAQTFAERSGSSSNSAASPVSAPPPLGIQWQYPGQFESAAIQYQGRIVSAPAVGRRMTYALSLGQAAGNGHPDRGPMLIAFDNDPVQDLDDDGRADDGIADYSWGVPYDRVWAAVLDNNWNGNNNDLTPRWSSPTVATLQLPTGQNIEVVLVSLTQINPGNNDGGAVVCYRADNGALLWSRWVAPYSGNARVVDLSTPSVRGDFVFLLTSEYDQGADAGNGVEDTFGRAHCFRLSYDWSANQNGPQWAFPANDTNPNGDGDTVGGNPDQAVTEQQRYLPPFQDPYWVAAVAPYANRPELPPFPTAKPTLVAPDPPSADSGAEVLLRCVSPISLVRSATAGEVDNSTTAGGSDWLLVPSPLTVLRTGTDLLNAYYHRVWLPEAPDLTDGAGNFLVRIAPTATVGRGDANITATVTGLWEDPADGRVYAYLRSAEAREYLLRSTVATNQKHFLELIQEGASITAQYQVRPTAPGPWGPDLTVVATLPAPVKQMLVSGEEHERRVASATVRRGSSILATDAIENNAGWLVHNDLTTPTASPASAADPVGRIKSVDNATGATNWSVRADMMSIDAYNLHLRVRGSVAVEPATGTAVAAVASILNPDATSQGVTRPAILGLHAEPRLVVSLRGGLPSAQLREGSTVTVRTLNWNRSALTVAGDVPTSAYRVDYATKSIEFVTDQSGFDSGTVGALWGKPVWVTYTVTDPGNPGNPATDVTVNDEMHVLPDIVRFDYTPWFIKLNHSLVRADAGSLSFNLPNGVPLTWPAGATVSPTIAAASLPNPPAGWTDIYGRAILAVTNLTMPGGEVLRPGSEFMVTYEYLDPVTLTVQTAHERHQVPVNFGTSDSSPVMAGYNMHVGTNGYLPTGMRGANYPLWNTELQAVAATPTPAQYSGTWKSLLSVTLDPITKTVRGALSQAAQAYAVPAGYASAPGLLGTPVTSGPPALDGDGVIVGSRLMTRLSQVAVAPNGYQGENFGYVSRLKPQRTLVCDTTRLVETIGNKLSWACTGTLAPQYHEALDPANLGNQELKVTAFSRPAKATYLPNGNILVCDTGNNRVVEIDRTGRQVWPLSGGYDLYTSTASADVPLDRPGDCFRYYVEYGAGSIRASVNGNMLPLRVNGSANPADWRGTIMHTVIADTGNARVVDIVTVVSPLGEQVHRVDVLTPSRVRLPQGTLKLAYTRAIPIFDPNIGNPAVVGYLCAAANMNQLVVVEAGTRRVNPGANAIMPGGSGTWRWLAWLYDSNPADADYAPSNPLIFNNLRDVQLTREGGLIYLTVTCGQYMGRYGDIARGVPPHWLSGQGPGVFEFAMDVSGAANTWGRVTVTDGAGGPTVTVDDPVWYFNNWDYTYRTRTGGQNNANRRSLTNIEYHDPLEAGGAPNRWLEMPWHPVACERLPVDRRALTVSGNPARAARHLITNYAQVIQNLSRDNVAGLGLGAPAMLGSGVVVVTSDDRNDAAPENDLHEMDRREVIPDPHEPDWTDPISQPAYADRR